MDYVEMIKDPELVLGFQELISDSDPVVVKRTVKVFTSVYYHTLRLLSAGELKEETLVNSWGSVKSVVDTLIGMVKGCTNEGTLIHLLRFLEAAIISHLMYDLSGFPFVFERGREIVKTGLKALKDLITTPYVGGSAFIVGVRALISIACLRSDLWEPVTDLIKKQLTSLPPTLFDHDVRSLRKMLQRNLFRLLRRAETPELKEKLIEMMVSVGAPRKAILPWAPSPAESKKRGSPTRSSDSGCQTPPKSPPEKKVRLNEEKVLPEHYSPRSDSPDAPSDPRLAPLDPRKNSQQSIAPANSKDNSATLESKIISNDLLFLTSLIPSGKKSEPKKTKDSCLEKELYDKLEKGLNDKLEKELYDKLDLSTVCNLVIHHVDAMPNTEPQNFAPSFEKIGKVTNNMVKMRGRISTQLSNYLVEHNIKSLAEPADSKSSFTEHTVDSRKDSKKALGQSNLVSPANSSSITASSSVSHSLKDTDLRQTYQRSTPSLVDVDMRISDPRLASRDPRLAKDPRLRKEIPDARMPFSQQKDHPADPRLDNCSTDHKPRIDPRVQCASDTKSDQRKTRWDRDPRTQPVAPHKPFSTGTQPTSSNITDPAMMQNDSRFNGPSTQNPAPFTHLDSGSFHQEMGNPRMPFPPTQVPNDPRIQQQSFPQPQMPNNPRMQQQSFPQPQFPFQFGPFNPINQFAPPFMPAIPAPLISSPPFGWQNSPNLQNPPPPFLVAQNLASPQQGLLPNTMINL